MEDKKKFILDVPYYSQYLDVSDENWKPRACGIVCLKMVMDYYNKQNPPLIALIEGVASRGGFGSSGWIHDTIIKTARDYDFNAQRKEYNFIEDGIKEQLEFLKDGNPVIVSVVKNFSEPNKFHMVVLTGFETDEKDLIGFYYHDPDAYKIEDGKYKFIPINVFKKYWRKLAIYVKI
jgi:uncharacterized protein YvpB